MTKNDIKTLLRQYKISKARVEELNIRFEELKYKDISSIEIKDNVSTSNLVSSSIERNFINKIDLETKLENEMKKYNILIKRTDNLLKVLTECEYEAVTLKYINEFTISAISRKMYISDRQILRYIDSALKKMTKILEV